MSLTTRTLPGYTIQSEDLNVFDAWFTSDVKVAVIGGHTALALTKEYLSEQLRAHGFSFFWTGGECNQSNHDRLLKEKMVHEYDWIIGVGGGRALDLAKWVADTVQKPILTIPTIASTCAACSAVSVVYDENHQFLRIQELYKAPEHVILLPTILVEAPASFLHAGIGDAISKPMEINFSGKHMPWSFHNHLGKSIAESALKILTEQGEMAYQANLSQSMNTSFINVVSAIIMGIGYASILVEEDYNSALAHALYNAFMRMDAVKKQPHGLVVAYGILVQCLVDEDQTSFSELYAFYQKLGLPKSLRTIGTQLDHKDLPSVIDAALKMPDCRFVSKQLNVTKVFEAMHTLELLESSSKEID